MRDMFSQCLIELATADSSVVLLTGDHGYALFDAFRQTCPAQYFNAGIAEQNMVGMAAGLARTGFRPIVYGLSAFIPIRVLEQIKLDIAHDQLPVILIGDGAGFVYSYLGTSHQSTEDIACARCIPHLQVYSPADAFEMRACMHQAYSAHAPVYLRMGKSDRGAVHDDSAFDLVPFNLVCLRKGHAKSLTFIATGSLTRCAMELVENIFPEASVWSVPYIKPINEEQIIDICSTSSVIVTFEEHSIYGGLGALVSEISSMNRPRHVLRIGVLDRFSEHCGSYDYLLKEHGLDYLTIADQIHSFCSQLR